LRTPPRSRSATRLKPNASCAQLIGPTRVKLHSGVRTLACSGKQSGICPAASAATHAGGRQQGSRALLSLENHASLGSAEDLMPSTSRERSGRARLEQGSPSSPLGSPRMAKLHTRVALRGRDGNNRAAPCPHSSANIAAAVSPYPRRHWTSIRPGSRKPACAAVRHPRETARGPPAGARARLAYAVLLRRLPQGLPQGVRKAR
jgi:hypothetical protein